MNRLLSSLLLVAFLSSAAVAANQTPSATPTEEAAQRLTALSVKEDVAANDPRVAQTRILLDKAVKLTREEPLAIAATCTRYVGHLHDSAQIEALPLELLEALVSFGKAGKPMRDTLQEYVVARKAAPGRSHAEAVAALGKKK